MCKCVKESFFGLFYMALRLVLSRAREDLLAVFVIVSSISWGGMFVGTEKNES